MLQRAGRALPVVLRDPGGPVQESLLENWRSRREEESVGVGGGQREIE